MKRGLAVLIAMAVAALAVLPSGALAASIGPICFTNSPFSDVFVFFLDANALGNQLVGTGRELNTNRAASFTLFVTGSSAVVGYHVFPTQSTRIDQIGGGVIATSGPFAGTGPGHCERTNSALGCGAGTDITLAIVGCPPNATSDNAAPADANRNPG